MKNRMFIVAGVAAAAFALAACNHHKEPVVAKGYAPVAGVSALGNVQPSADWK